MIVVMVIKLRNWAIAALVISVIMLVILFTFTNPREVGLFGILMAILAIYALCASCFYLAITSFGKGKNSMQNNNERRQLLISFVLAFAPVFLIIFNSLGAVGIVEVILIVFFEAVTIFLITKRT